MNKKIVFTFLCIINTALLLYIPYHLLRFEFLDFNRGPYFASIIFFIGTFVLLWANTVSRTFSLLRRCVLLIIGIGSPVIYFAFGYKPDAGIESLMVGITMVSLLMNLGFLYLQKVTLRQ